MWKTISSKEIFHHPRLTLVEDEVLLPNGVRTRYLKYKDNGDCAVTVIARRNDGHILLQKEFSYPSKAYLFQFPGGGVPAGETPKAGANRELMEEAGLKAGRLLPLGSYLTQNRRSKKRMYVFLGTKLIKQSRPPDAEEIIESFWFSERAVEQLITTNRIVNCHVLAAWCLYTRKKLNRPWSGAKTKKKKPVVKTD